jgi:hypothetical protein
MKFAIKRLQHSDLTFFEPYFRASTGAKQKAINLDAAVFADSFFPRLSRTNPSRPKRVLFELTVIGPNGAPPFSLTRKALLQQKNWRLNGEMIDDKENAARFEALAPGDLAIMAFDGDDEPVAVNMVVLSAASSADSAAHRAAGAMLGEGSMIAVDAAALAAAFAPIAADHPARLILPDNDLEQALEDAAAGSAGAVEELRKRAGAGRLLRRITVDDLMRARDRASHIGALGEEAVADFLEGERNAGQIRDFDHTSKSVSAAHPFDFTLTLADGSSVRMDVKATTGPFGRPFHMSGAEVRDAAGSPVPYVIWRVYQLSDDGTASLRRSADIRDFARAIANAALPPGVAPDGYSIEPAVLAWDTETHLQ